MNLIKLFCMTVTAVTVVFKVPLYLYISPSFDITV